MNNSIILRIKTETHSRYYFQICISVRLIKLQAFRLDSRTIYFLIDKQYILSRHEICKSAEEILWVGIYVD